MNSGTSSVSPLLLKQLPNIAPHRLADLLQGLDGGVLGAALQPGEGGLADAQLAGEGILGFIAAQGADVFSEDTGQVHNPYVSMAVYSHVNNGMLGSCRSNNRRRVRYLRRA